ncbi:MAG: EamA family transporter [Bacteroidaceae bacterium]|nr:EamA family transporter [Bacteroidaceae bacterium]
MKTKRLYIYHLLAFLTVALWGVTFISTKTLINQGLTPAQIFTIRFIIAYLGLLTVCFIRGGRDKRAFSLSLRHELLFVVMGISGGSLYFLTENTALQHTQACNVSFIVCIAPLLTLLMTLFIKRTFKGNIADGLEDVRVGFPLIAGTVLAISGMVLVIFDGNSLSISPKGDILAFMAALCWAFYSQFMGQMTDRYGTLFATRKVFFYGLLTIVPVLLLADNSNLAAVRFDRVQVWGNLLFLSTIASLFCFVLWNRIMLAIGNVTATNYVYMNPVITLIGAMLILDERMTVASGIGSAMILGGVILSGVKTKERTEQNKQKI